MATTTKKAVAKKAPAKKTVAKKTATAKKTVAKKAPAKKTPSAKKESKMKELKVGTDVLVRVDPRTNGGSDVAPGKVTKAGDESVNVTVFTDGDENQWLTNVAVVKSAPKEDDEVVGRICWPA